MILAKSKMVCIACSVFKKELEALLKSGEIDFPIQFLDSMLHMQPVELNRCLTQCINEPKLKDSNIMLIFGECHNDMKKYESSSRIYRVNGCNCVEIILGNELYWKLQKEGVFFLLPEWTLRWKEIFEKELGLTDEIAKDFMQEMHSKLLYLDTGQMPVPVNHLKNASETLGLPWEVLKVDLRPLLNVIANAMKRMNES